MKKTTLTILILIIATALVMTGCGKSSDNSDSSSGEPLKYNIERIDSSKTSEVDSDMFGMTQYYDLLTIEGEGDAATAINEEINENYDEFKAILSQTDEYFSEKENSLKEAGKSASGSKEEYTNTVEARVSQNDGKVFSVVYSSEWYMGGVYNADTTAMTFDSSTGEKLNLAKYLNVSEAMAMKYVLNTLAKEMNSNPDAFDDDSYDLASELTADDIDFYVEKDKVYICFETYEIACGACGSYVFELLTDGKTEERKTAHADKDKWYFSLDADSDTSLGIGINDLKDAVYAKVTSDIKSESDVIYNDETMDGPFESFKVTLSDGTNLYFKKQVGNSNDFHLCGISTTNSDVKFGRGICVGMTEEEVRAVIPDFSDSNDLVYAKDLNYIEDEVVNYAVSTGAKVYFSAEKDNNVIYLCTSVFESDWSIYDMILELKDGKVSKIKLSDGFVTYPEFE